MVSGSCCNGALAVISGSVCALSPSTIDWSNATISDSVDIEGLKLLSGDLSSSQMESFFVNNSTVKLADVCQQDEFIGSVIASSSAASLVMVAHLLLNPSNARTSARAASSFRLASAGTLNEGQPMHMPQAMATTFLSAPESSAPRMSVV